MDKSDDKYDLHSLDSALLLHGCMLVKSV